MIDFSGLSPSERHVLIVDDELIIHRVMGAMLTKLGFTYKNAMDGNEAIEILKKEDFSVALLDINMPDPNGLEICKWISKNKENLGIIIISGEADLSTVVEIMKNGAYDYIQKPISFDALSISLSNTIEKRALLIENRIYQSQLEDIILDRTEQLQKALEEAERNFENILLAFVQALETREHETQQHSLRVSEYALHIGKHVGLHHKQLQIIQKGALLHDIGKIGVPDNILMKPGPLNSEEWEVMKKHPLIGAKMLRHIDTLESAANLVLTHHEKFDGSGYPQGLKGEEIPIEARIFTIADTLDAMTSDRPYRNALSIDKVYQEIEKCSGTQFDPDIAKVFTSIPPDEFSDIKDKIALKFSLESQNKRPKKSLKSFFSFDPKRIGT